MYEYQDYTILIETNFESVHKKLEGIRQKSYEYLLAALKDEGSTDL